jgi:hypothetical protein
MSDTDFKPFEVLFLDRALPIMGHLCEQVAGRGLEGFGEPLMVLNDKSCGWRIDHGKCSVSLYIEDGEDVGVSGPTMGLCFSAGEESGQTVWFDANALAEPLEDPQEIDRRLGLLNVVDAAKWIVTEWCNHQLRARPARYAAVG